MWNTEGVVEEEDGMERQMKKPYLCIYCQRGKVKKLPAKCPACKRSLKLALKDSTPLVKIVDRYFANGLRLNVKNAGPGHGEISFQPVRTSIEKR